MDPIERARQLRQEADFVLQELRVHDIVAPYSNIIPTGSYFLDVMVFPDIDLYLPAISIEQLFAIGGKIANSPLVSEVVFAKSTDESLPGGLYLKLRIQYGDWGRPWKIDF